MKSNYWVMLLCLLASGFIGCSDDDGDNWKKTFEDEQARIKDFVYSKDSDPKIFKYQYIYLKENIEDYAYLFNYQKEGKKATYGDFVWINYTQKSLTGNIIDSSGSECCRRCRSFSLLYFRRTDISANEYRCGKIYRSVI